MTQKGQSQFSTQVTPKKKKIYSVYSKNALVEIKEPSFSTKLNHYLDNLETRCTLLRAQ